MAELIYSLIIPAYNEEKYIGDCLEYAIKNSGGIFKEIIVIDNASTDKTSKAAAKYPGVRVVLEENKGLTRARQRGFVEATGDILVYLDADSRMSAEWIKKVSHEFTKNLRLAAISGPVLFYDVSRLNQILSRVYCYLLMVPAAFVIGYLLNGAGFAIKREVLQKMKGFDASIEFYGEDTDIGRRAYAFGQVKFDPQLIIPTSGRRVKGQGTFRTAFLYVSNYLFQALFHRPITNKYIDIR